MDLARRFRYWSRYLFTPNRLLLDKYQAFREVLRHDRKSLELLGDLEDICYSGTPVDWARITRLITALRWSIDSLIRSLTAMHPGLYRDLEQRFQHLETHLLEQVTLPATETAPPYVISIAEAAAAPHLAGGKAHTLGTLLRDTDLPQPAGFVITTSAGNLLLDRNDLRPRLDELLGEITLNDAQRLNALSAEMVALVEAAEIPEEISTAVGCRLAEFRRQQTGSPERWAVRSSAIGEDSAFSFAGQYVSVLSVAPEQVLAVYKTVLAGKYRPGALAYRIRCGLADQETAMAALVMEMIEARAGGVIYTRDPAVGSADEHNTTLAIYAVSGLGEHLVNGSGQPEIHRFTLCSDGQTTTQETVNHERHASDPPLLDDATAQLLAAWGLQLEALAGRPQDIEWCQDSRGSCLLLQCRPLSSGERAAAEQTTDPAGDPPLPPLLAGGTCAAPGIGIGTVHVLRDAHNLADLPAGSVLVLPTMPPTLAGLLGYLQAVVAEGGSRASHFATVARESGLPVITGLIGAMDTLDGCGEVTVDAWSGRVYQGRVETLAARYPTRTALLDAPLVARLSRVSALVSPLHLLDPTAASFSPDHCTSMHDLIRYAHEKAMTEMFSLVGPGGRELSGARIVHSELPLTLSLIDLGGGLTIAAAKDQRQITPARFSSPLLRACWQGLTHPDVTWHQGLACLDWEQADRVSAGIISLKSPLLGSYGVVAHDYLHLLLRFGYHFTVIDCLAGSDDEANYLAFRFKGGGGTYEMRLRRVRLISEILHWAGFSVHTHGDLLDARFDRRPAADFPPRLTALGFIQGKCQLLDMALTDDAALTPLRESFTQSLQDLFTHPANKQEGT
jgi:pyruvate, water dikinase